MKLREEGGGVYRKVYNAFELVDRGVLVEVEVDADCSSIVEELA